MLCWTQGLVSPIKVVRVDRDFDNITFNHFYRRYKSLWCRRQNLCQGRDTGISRPIKRFVLEVPLVPDALEILVDILRFEHGGQLCS